MTAPLRVATVITRFQAGAGVVALRGALALDPESFCVSIIAGSGDRLIQEAVDAGLSVELEPSLRSPLEPVADVLAVHRLTQLLRRGQFDVVHTHSAKAGAVGRWAAHRAGVQRIVHTYHGFPFHEFQSAPRRTAYVNLERRLGRITDIALCVGAGVAAEAVQRRLIAPERIRTIGVTVDREPLPLTPQRRTAARRTLGVPPGMRVVGAVGRLAYQKAPEDFVRALVALDRSDVVGVWVGTGELADQIRRAVAEAAPHTRVLLTGDRADVADLLPAFDVFALPSRYEGMPVAIVEAMACGIPIVATAVNAVPDLVVPGMTGMLVPPEHPELLAGAIGYLLDHPARATAMAAAGRAAVRNRFSAEALGHALSEAYVPGPDVDPHDKEPSATADRAGPTLPGHQPGSVQNVRESAWT